MKRETEQGCGAEANKFAKQSVGIREDERSSKRQKREDGRGERDI